jgi:hypothetical protein
MKAGSYRFNKAHDRPSMLVGFLTMRLKFALRTSITTRRKGSQECGFPLRCCSTCGLRHCQQNQWNGRNPLVGQLIAAFRR